MADAKDTVDDAVKKVTGNCLPRRPRIDLSEEAAGWS
jgi:hypothetical protein